MGPIFRPLPRLGFIKLIIFWCEAEMAARTFLIVIKVRGKDELRLSKLEEGTEMRYERTDLDVLRLHRKDLRGSSG